MASIADGGAPAPSISPWRTKCSVCHHAKRAEIDDALVAGMGTRTLATQYPDLTRSSLERHSRNHVRARMAAVLTARADEDMAYSGSLVDKAAELREKALELLSKAEKAGDLRTALQGCREAARCLELVGKLTGAIDESAKLNIVLAPALVELQTIVLTALADHPAARMAVAAALGNLAAPAASPMIEYRPQP